MRVCVLYVMHVPRTVLSIYFIESCHVWTGLVANIFRFGYHFHKLFFPSRYFRHAGSSLIILSKNLAQYININRFVVNVINRFSFGYKCRYKLSSYENEFVRLIYAFHYPVNKSRSHFCLLSYAVHL